MKKSGFLRGGDIVVVASMSFSIVLMALWVSCAYAASWKVETVDVGFVGKYDSLIIDSSGRPHISYYDDRNGNLKYATKVGTAWVSEVVALAGKPNGGSNAVYTSIAVDFAGKPHIVFFDDNTNQLKYAVKFNSSWTIEIADPGCGPPCALNGYFPSLALDSQGNPHISYYGNPGGIHDGYLKYAVKSGGSWKTEIVDTDGDSGYETSITLDSSGRPHIAYVRYPDLLSHGANTLKYATKSGRAWAIEVVDASGRMNFCSIALDSSGNPRISYHEWNIGSLLFAAKSGGAWKKESVDQPANVIVGRYSSLVVDPKANIPQISYFDITNRVLKYAANKGQNWVTQVVDFNGDVGRYSRIALDLSGEAHISYYDATTYSLKYASMLKPKPLIPVKVVAISPPDFPYKVTVETACVESVGGACLRREIVRTCVGGNCFDIPPSVTGPQCAFCGPGISGLIGMGISGLIGMALGGIGSVWVVRRRRTRLESSGLQKLDT